MSRALVICAVLVLCAAGPSCASDIEDLVEAERGFAKAAATDGMRDAFLAVLSKDAVLFRPGPVNGRDWFEANPPPRGVLAWDPVHAEVSKAGDLGYTTGPWRYDLEGRDAVFGHYVSIWRRAKKHSWQLVVDIGIGHGEPERSAWAPAIDEQQGGERTKRLPRDRLDRLESELIEADGEFSREVVEKGPAEAYGRVGAKTIRLYRDGRFPVVGLAVVRQALEDAPVPRPAESLATVIAGSGEFGYSYGVSRGSEADEGGGYNFLRIWTRNEDGAWKIVLDLAAAAP
jgi:ketosteroid isomerase-like protein